MRTLRIKRQNFDAIMSGRKNLEIRVGYGNIKTISQGDLLRLQVGRISGVVSVNAIRTYDSFQEMLRSESLHSIMPWISDEATALQALRDIYPSHKESLGVYVIEVAKQRD